ncbi:hypothetical protein M434DRAFT_28001 [Hypoxylon sp. CO27-5]|nr:hypothetical protein M434DRAFT_28001 [Hypoxylon sp. CO27-5]
MTQATVKPNQTAGIRGQQASSEMMRYYLISRPSTTTDRLTQGIILSDKEIKEDLERKRIQVEALVKLAKGESSRST